MLELLWELVCGYQMLFGVPDEIPDVTRSSGGEELYIGSPVSATGKVSGVTGIVPGPPKGFRGSTYPGRPYGLYVEGNQPLSGLGTIPPKAHAPRVGGEP